MKENSIGLVVFDWAGTTVDYGCIAPLEVFRRCFEARGIFLSPEEIRKPMGLEKKDHIRTLMETETASEQWKARYGKEWTEEDVQAIYESFEEMLKNTVAEYSQVLPGSKSGKAEAQRKTNQVVNGVDFVSFDELADTRYQDAKYEIHFVMEIVQASDEWEVSQDAVKEMFGLTLAEPAGWQTDKYQAVIDWPE